MPVKMTRGAFVESCVLALSAFCAGVSPVIRGSLRIADATADTFLPHVGSTFTMDGLRLKLTEVAVRPTTSRIEQFSLFFRGSADDALPDGTHPVTHHALGSFDLSLVNVGPRQSDRRTYQAVFSRLLDQNAACSRA